jgi:hypothetical protein
MRGIQRLLRVLGVLGASSIAPAGCSSSPSFPTAPHQAYPPVPTSGGPTLQSCSVVTVSFAGDPNASAIDAFVNWLGQGFIATATSEYGIKGVRHAPAVTLTETAPTSIADDAIAALLTARIADGTIPAAPSSTTPYVYLVLFPPGTDVTHLGNDACAPNPGNGFHDVVLDGPSQLPIVVLPTCDPRFGAILSDIAVMQLDAARLLVDTVTDPWIHSEPAFAIDDFTNPWASFGHEVGDLCWGRFTEGGSMYTLQRVWSNRAAASGGEACIPVPTGAAFGVSASPSGLPSLQVGVPMSFAVTGWSTAPVADWAVQVTPWVGDYAIATSLDHTTMNNGEQATLTVTVPYAVPSGSYGAVRIESLSSTDTPSWPVAFTVR